jgi:hypothetical protein
MDVPLFYVKGKRAFRKELGSLRPLGNAPRLVRSLSDQYSLFHIIDLDALKGNRTNFDVYDHLTYFTHVQVELKPDPSLIAPLLEMDVRIVLPLPTKLDLSQFSSKKNFLLGKVSPSYEGSFEGLREILLDGKDDLLARRILSEGKRLFVKKEFYPKGYRRAFGTLFPL